MRDASRPSEEPRRNCGRLHSTLWGAGGAVGITLAQLLQGVVLIPVYLKYMSLADYGVWLASGNLITWLALVDPGFGEIARIRIAQALGKRDVSQASAVATAAFIYAAGAAIVFCIAGLGLSTLVPTLIPVAASSRGSLQTALSLSVVGTGLVLISYVVGDVLSAAQRQRVVSITTVAGLFLGIAVSVTVLLVSGNGLVALGIAPLIRGALSLLVLVPKCCSALRREGIQRLRWSGAVASEFGKTGAAVFVARAGNTFSQTGDALLIAWLVGAPEAALYSLGARARDLLQGLPARLTSAAIPAMAHRIGEAHGSVPEMREGNARLAVAISAIGVAVTAGLMLGFVAANRVFVSLWIGADKSPGLMMNVAIGLAGFALGIREALHSALLAYGRVRTVAFQNILESLVKVFAAVALVAALGSIGAPLGALFATCLVLPRGFALVQQTTGGNVRVGNLVVVALGSAVLVGAVGSAIAAWLPLSAGVSVFVAAAGASGTIGIGFALAISPSARETVHAAMERIRSITRGRQGDSDEEWADAPSRAAGARVGFDGRQ